MLRQDLSADRALSPSRETHDPEDAGMGSRMDNRQLPEILVEGDEDPTLGVGRSQNLLVSRILEPTSRRDDIVTGSLQLSAGASPDACVEEDLHRPVGSIRGSTRSCATRRRA